MSSHLRATDDGDDDDARPSGSRARPPRSMAREASDGTLGPPVTPTRPKPAMKTERSPKKKATFAAPGVFKPSSSGGNDNEKSKRFLESTVFQPGKESSSSSNRSPVRADKEGTSKSKTSERRISSAMRQQSDSGLDDFLASSGPKPKSALKQRSSRSFGADAVSSSKKNRTKIKIDDGRAHHRKEVKFVYPEAVKDKKKRSKEEAETAAAPSPPLEFDVKPPKKEDRDGRRESMKKFVSNASLIEDKSKFETRWDWTTLLIQHALKPYRKALSENDDLLPDPDELDAFESKDEDDEEQLFIDEVRDQMLDDGQLSEREIACFFSGFTLFDAKVKSLQSQLLSAKTMAFQHVVPSGMAGTSTSMHSLADYRSMSLSDFSGRKVADAKRSSGLLATRGSERGLSCKKMSIMRIQHDPKTSQEHQKLLKELEDAEKKQKKLELQLKQAGLQIAEDIPYQEAKENVSRIAARMQEIGSSEVTHPDKKKQAELREEYFKLEQDMEKFSTALMLTDEYIEEQEEKELSWEQKNEGPNMEALRKLRRHMPVSVKSLSEAQLCSQPTPNGRKLPREIAKKFKRTNVLQLLRTNPEDICRMHPSTLENMRVTGMTLTERRAMYAHLLVVGPRWKAMQADAMTERKWTWYTMMRTNFKETLEQYEYHVEQYGPPGNHPYATRDNPNAGCPLIGKQCPLRADKQPSYEEDYGFTQEAEYEVTQVKKADVEDSGAKAVSDAAALAKEKRASERLDALKKHYKGVLQVSLANGSCETMDEALETMEALQEKWIENGIMQGDEDVAEDARRKEMIRLGDALNDLRLQVLQFAERSGMQLTGKKDANADKLDVRSPLELGLCEEVCEHAIDFFAGIKQRMKELGVKDKRMKVSIDQLRELLDELHERNVKTLDKLDVKRPPPSRKRKTREAMTNEIKEKYQPEVDEIAAPDSCATSSSQSMDRHISGGRGDLMSAIAARGSRGSGRNGGRGDLMSAIAARGRGGRDSGGRGDLMSAIAARGSRGSGRNGGRGDLMSAIAARGRGGRDSGGRGDLMSAIAARGSRGSGRNGGRGDLMSAIAARGRGGRDSGGRGDLMSAIAARGSRGSGRNGGRGDLMSAIAARGGGGPGSGNGDVSETGSSGRSGHPNASTRNRAVSKGEDRAGSSSGGRGNFLAEIQAKAAARDASSEDP